MAEENRMTRESKNDFKNGLLIVAGATLTGIALSLPLGVAYTALAGVMYLLGLS